MKTDSTNDKCSATLSPLHASSSAGWVVEGIVEEGGAEEGWEMWEGIGCYHWQAVYIKVWSSKL